MNDEKSTKTDSRVMNGVSSYRLSPSEIWYSGYWVSLKQFFWVFSWWLITYIFNLIKIKINSNNFINCITNYDVTFTFRYAESLRNYFFRITKNRLLVTLLVKYMIHSIEYSAIPFCPYVNTKSSGRFSFEFYIWKTTLTLLKSSVKGSSSCPNPYFDKGKTRNIQRWS